MLDQPITYVKHVFSFKNVLIVEDIIDTGNTMTKLLQLTERFEPKSVKVIRCVWIV